jgi:CSLREA domain-containing protein
MQTPKFPRRTAKRFATVLTAFAIVSVLAATFLYISGRSANTTYYSKASLPPELVTSWSTTRNGLGTPPTNFTGGDTFVIQNTHNMTTAATWSVSGTNSKVQIENGGTLTANNAVTLASATTFQIDNGGTYVQNVAMAMGSNILQGTEVFGASSNFIVQVTPTGTSTPSSPGYGNLTFNITTGAANFGWGATITDIQGNFTIQSTGSAATVEQRMTSSGNLTMNIGGNLSISGGTLVLTSGAGVPTINLGGNYNQTGGTLTSTSTGIGTVNFTGGTSSVNFTKSAGTLTPTNINWSIANGKTVQFNNAFTNAASRTFTINTGGLLLAAATITNSGTMTVNGDYRLTDGGFANGTNFVYGANGILSFTTASGYTVDGTHVYWPTTNGPQNITVYFGGITMNAARTVNGLFQYASGVNNAGNLTLNGTSQVNTGGFMSGSPTYGSNSLLKYNTGGSYGRNGEWLPNVSSGAGYPANVQLSGNTSLNLPNGSNNLPFQMAGNLTIDSGSTMSMSPLAQPLVVLGSIVNSGTLTLSTAPAGDLLVGGNWTRDAAATFNPNGRAVAFTGSGLQNIQIVGGGTETFSYLAVSGTNNTVAPDTSLGVTNVAVNGASGNVLQLLGGNFGLVSGTSLTLGGNGGNILVSGSARSITGTGSVNFTGAKTVASTSSGTLNFASTVNVNLSNGVDFGGVSTVNGVLTILAGGFVNTNPPTYAAGSSLQYDNGTTYNAAAEFPATGVQNVSLASTTQLNLNGDKTIAGSFVVGNNTIGSTAATPFSLSASAINLGSGTINVNNLTTSSLFSAGTGTLNVAGNWNVNSFSANSSTVNFNGTGAQTVQTATTFNNLTTSNDITLGSPATVNGTLALGAKKITTGANTLSLGNAATVTRTSGYVLGALQKSFNAPANFTFPVGTTNGYSPVEANSTTGTGALSVSAHQQPYSAVNSNVLSTNALQRYWTLAGSGITTNLTFNYLDGDVNVTAPTTEADYKVFKFSSPATLPPAQSLDPDNNRATVNGVSTFSDWTLAADSSIYGSLQFDMSSYSVNEDAGTVTLNVTRTGGSSGAVGVSYTTVDGTATSGAGNDYTGNSGTLSWTDGDSASKPITITILDDGAFEGDQIFNVNITNPTGGAVLGTPNDVPVTITDNDSAALPNVVYVDDDFTGANGTDPDGAGPATEIGYDAFKTVQGGVNGVAPNGTVNVAAGTYAEQVIIGKSLTLTGAGAATTTINTPATLTPGIGGNLVIVEVNGGATVTASGIAVAGPRNFNGCSAQIFYGVFVSGAATLNLSNSTVRDIRLADPSLIGCQDGIAVRAGSQALAQTATLSLNNVSVTNYQKSAVILDGAGTTGTITNSTLTGQGVPANIASNAIQIGRGAGATVTGSTVSGNLCNNPACGPDPFTQSFSTGALVFSTTAAVSFSNNTFSTNDVGIYNNAANTTVSGNTFTANRHENLFLDEGNATISDNNMSGASNVGVLAISYVGNAGNSSGTLTRNNITGATTGLQMLDDTSGADNFTPQLTAHFNRIVSTTTAIDNPQNQTADFENNWWGCNAGPGNAGCGTVTGTGADYNPWFVMSASATPDSIVPGGTSNVAVDMTKNSNGDAPATTLPDLPVSYSATNGTMSPTSATVSSGVSSSTFTSTNSNSATASATVDNQTVNVPITVNAPSFSIDDVSHVEGNSGTTSYVFTVTKTGATNLPSSVDFTTVDGTATTADNDYQANSGTLNFGAADTALQITVLVNGDTTIEPDEAFTVHLSNPTGVTASGVSISDADGTGTITNDDRPIPNVVYVDDDFTGANGTDPDGAGPATEIGYDAFPTIQGGINGVAPNGTVNVAAGNYNEDVNVNKTVSLLGAGAGTTNISGPIGGPGTTVFITASNSTVANFTITRNGNNTTDWNNPGLNSAGIAIQGQAVTNALVRDNIITGNRTAIDINNSNGHTIRNNVIDFNRTGLLFRNQTDLMRVMENFITNNWTVGVLFLDASSGTNSPRQSATASAFTNNNISANWYGQIVDRQSGGSLPAPGTTNLKNFRGNWLGSTAPVVTTANSAEPGYAAQIPTAYGGTATAPGGQPDIAGPASANIKYIPFLQSGTDTNVETTPGRGTNGFQGVTAQTTLVVYPPNQNGWVIDTSGTATATFVHGPATPPLGVGSGQLSVGSDGESAAQFRQTNFNGTPLSDLTALSYSTYTSNDTTPQPVGDQTVYIIINTDRDGNGTLDTLLFFEPEYQHGYTNAVPDQGDNVLNTWQTWNARGGGWYAIDPANGDPVFAGPGSNVEPLNNFITAFPAALIHNASSGSVRLVAGFGAGSWDNFVGNVDNVNIGVNSTNTTYDFEPLPQLSIDDVTHAEGDSGTTAYDFTVSLSRAIDAPVTFTVATADNTATSPSDYAAVSPTPVTIPAGQTSATVTVQANGDTTFEPDETFFVNLSNPVNATISDGQGTGTITNDDPVPSMSIGDRTMAEGNSGTTAFDFTVTLSNASSTPITVHYSTADGTASASSDYAGVSDAVLTIPANTTSGTITISVSGDATYEANETFFVNLSNPSGATITDGQGNGVITNDDAPPATLVVNTTDDADDGFCLSDHCSLREAINAANLFADTNTVSFQIPVTDARHFYYADDGVAGQVSQAAISTTTADDSANTDLDPDWAHSWWSIQPAAPLADITQPVVVDGYTQPTASANTLPAGSNAVLRIELSGGFVPANEYGLTITAINSTVKGLVINRFAHSGIAVQGATPTNNTVQGNRIGTDVSGTAALGNGDRAAVEFNASNGNTLGGTNPADRNLLSGGNAYGVFLINGAYGNTVQGNLIGTDASGALDLGNAQIGVLIDNRTGNTIRANVISGNGADGIQIRNNSATGTNNTVQGNLIGTDATGANAVGNTGHGIADVRSGSDMSVGGNTIGGAGAGEANTIAFNGGDGVAVVSGTGTISGTTVSRNSIHTNNGLGIDLADDGVTPNDADDTDTGANDLQNFPVVTSAVTSSTTTIKGTLNSTPSTTFTVEFFSNASCDASGNGEGQNFVGSLTNVTTDANGDATFTFQTASPVSSGQFITTTATNPAGSTSEFSACHTVVSAGSIQFSSSTFTVSEDGTQASITITRTGGAGGAVSVTFDTSNGTATAGQDYTAVNNVTVAFADGDAAPKTVNVPITDDNLYEGDETVNLTLSNPQGGATLGTPATAVLTITENDPLPAVSIDDVTRNEGNSGVTFFSFTLSLSRESVQTVTVTANTADGTATAPSDYTAITNQTITFAPFETIKTITVQVKGDTAFEDNETFFVNLSNPTNATLADDQGLGTITNDDAPGTSLVVNTTNDNDDGSCQVSHCSLREAINAANLNADANTISFQIPANDARHLYYINDNVAGQVTAVLVAATTEADDANITNIDPDWPHSWWSIRPGIGGLPSITNPVTIDGYTQTGATANTSATITNAVLRVELLGTNAGAGGDGLRVVTRNSVMRGFSINRFPGDGIVLKEDVDAANDGDSNAVRGNYIGTDISGTLDLGNGANGITTEVDNTSHNSDTNTIGGTTPADRNLISGNTGHGILMTFSSGNIIRGNIIGLAANGTNALGNSGAGVEVTGSFIGGDDDDDGTLDGANGSRNVISANGTNGIQFVSTGASTVQGNYIGTDVSGTLDRGNAGSGINSSGFSKNIGGTEAGAGNLISGNDGHGILLSGGNGNLVFGNFIGTQADGTTALPNGGNGITLTASTIFNTIGGTNAGEANRIAFNGGDGINLDPTAGANNALRGNSIHSNGTTASHLGIDLGADGVTPNDSQDPDTGANSLQNFPVLTSATVTGSTKKITGTLNSTPEQFFTVDFYANTSCDASGNGEGQTHIGSITTAMTDANGNVSFSFNPTTLTVGQIITATATNNLNSTSEFSACVMVVGGTAGEIRFTSATYTVAENVAGGTASITVERVGGSDGQITATFSTSNGTATAGQDYTAVTNHTFTFNDGETGMKTVNVPILDDNVYEGDETVNLSLSGTTVNIAGHRLSVANGPTGAVLTITDAADTPAISINDVFVSEPSSAGTSNAVFTVTLSHPSNAPVTVDYQTADGTATAPADYNAVPVTTLTFAPNETSKTITVTVNFDNLTEGNETFTVNLSNPTGSATIADGTGTGTITDPVAEGQLLISEFRFRGPTYDVGGGVDGSRDEFIELYNNTDVPLTVSTTDGSDGWSVAALSSDGMSAVPLVTIPAGTVIPARAHYLVANSAEPVNPATGGYSLGAYAAPDKLYLPDIADNSGVAVFTTATTANYSLGNRLDAAGFSGTTGATAELFREGAGLTSPGANDGQYAFVRKLTSGFPQDTDVNADDFTFISTDGGTYGVVVSILGAPGPENKPTSPVQRNAVVKASLIDGTVSSAAPPNRVRSGQVQPGVPNAYGTLSIQRRFKNTLAVPITRLRFRVVDITTLNTPVASSPQADLRVLSSTGTVTNSQGQVVVTVTGLTLETPPAQPNGGGLNSSLTVIPPGGMLAPGASIDVQFLLGVEQQGAFRFLVNVEALPGPSNTPAPDQANLRRSGTKTNGSGKQQ